MSSLATSENQDVSAEESLALLNSVKKFKARSHTTCHETHLPDLLSQQTSPDIVLIGDSMIERLKTTGASTHIANLPSSFNAGVGGDKIENVLYRLAFMLPHLNPDIKLWVVMVGTNNLKKSLKVKEIEAYRLLLQTLLRVAPESKILVCELFKRKDVDGGYVEESNGMIRGMIESINQNLGKRVFWSEAMDVGDVLDDHVHLNKEGYRRWDTVLWARIEGLLKK